MMATVQLLWEHKYDQQEKILEEKLKSMRPLMQKLENNSGPASDIIEVGNGADASPKRRHNVEQFVVDKKFRFDLDDDDDDDNVDVDDK